MTAITTLLDKAPCMFRRAFAQTQDVNEANLIVHTVMTHAIGRITDPAYEIAPILTRVMARQLRASVSV